MKRDMSKMSEELLNKLRNQAFDKLKRGTINTDLSVFTNEEFERIKEIISDIDCKYHCKGFESDEYVNVIFQIYRDIKVGYKKYDCIAMWLDMEGGLVKYEPELIKRIAIEVGMLEE